MLPLKVDECDYPLEGVDVSTKSRRIGIHCLEEAYSTPPGGHTPKIVSGSVAYFNSILNTQLQ